jgi:adenylate cyclase class 2
MRELEAKLSVGRPVDEVVAVLDRLGYRFGPRRRQDDFVFAESAATIVGGLDGSVVARVRVDSRTGAALTVKARRSSELDRVEYETGIADAEAAKRALGLLGLTEQIVVRKHRRECRVDTVLTITVDEVQGLGTFIELEVLGDGQQAEAMLESLVDDIGRAVPASRRVFVGYDTLMMSHGRLGDGGSS